MKIWNEEESLGGAPTAYTPPGVLSKISNIRAPEGRIHWAGTETALVSQGYMNGAIESGIRVSKEILGRFKEETPVTWRKEAIQPEAKWYAHISTSKRGFFSRL